MALKINMPQTRFVDPDGTVNRAWRDWLLNPQLFTIIIQTALGVESGGTGLTTAPADGQLLIGSGGGYAFISVLPATSGGTGQSTPPATGQLLVGNGAAFDLASTLPDSAFPALTGDITVSAGTTVTTLATVNAGVGTFGAGDMVGVFTVNAKGLTTAASATPITGAPGDFTAVGKFGCNGKAAQASVSAAPVATTAATNIAPYGFTTAAQANTIVTLLNQIQAALVANGILV